MQPTKRSRAPQGSVPAAARNGSARGDTASNYIKVVPGAEYEDPISYDDYIMDMDTLDRHPMVMGEYAGNGNEKALHADFYNKFSDLFDDDDLD